MDLLTITKQGDNFILNKVYNKTTYKEIDSFLIKFCKNYSKQFESIDKLELEDFNTDWEGDSIIYKVVNKGIDNVYVRGDVDEVKYIDSIDEYYLTKTEITFYINVLDKDGCDVPFSNALMDIPAKIIRQADNKFKSDLAFEGRYGNLDYYLTSDQMKMRDEATEIMRAAFYGY